jgi:hypothetical protein
LPEPFLKTITRELPLAQPERFTISWTMAVRAGVRCFLSTVQAPGDQVTAALVRGREEMFALVFLKVGALLLASPRIAIDAVDDRLAFAVNSR